MKSADFEDGIFVFKEKNGGWTVIICPCRQNSQQKTSQKSFWDVFSIYFFSKPIVNPK